MGKRIIKNRKPKLARSSSIEKTIDDGKDFIVRADRRLRKTKVGTLAKTNKAKATIEPKKKIAKRRVPKKAARPTPVSVPAVAISAPAVVPVARSASRNLSKSGSKGNIII
jgi:hypothetical protein